MNYGEIKQNLISLGFAEDTDYEEYEDLGYTYDSINRAFDLIKQEFPYIATYTFDLDADETEPYTVRLDNLDGFLSLAEDTPVLIEREGEGTFVSFSNFIVKAGTEMIIPPQGFNGTVKIYYEKNPTRVTSDTADTFVPELPLRVHHLIPLLAAYYLWLDDDAAKATQYYNMYETTRDDILQKDNRPDIGIATGWGEM